MTSRLSIKHPGQAAALTHALGAACVTALLSTTACAATQPFNPGGLATGPLSRVQDICQNVMGLSPTERLTGGTWHSDRLDYDTSKYRGCVTSLSDSIQDLVEQQAVKQADQDCRSRGYGSGSPDLALCVLQAKERFQGAAATQTSTALQPAAMQPPAAAPGSFYAVRPHETHRRELTACAALGLEPSAPAFQSCVKNLDDTFFAIDNPIT